MLTPPPPLEVPPLDAPPAGAPPVGAPPVAVPPLLLPPLPASPPIGWESSASSPLGSLAGATPQAAANRNETTTPAPPRSWLFMEILGWMPLMDDIDHALLLERVSFGHLPVIKTARASPTAERCSPYEKLGGSYPKPA
jgi:hypothetical protein